MSQQILKSLDFLLQNADFTELKEGSGLKIDLRYGSSNNFVGYDMYGPFRKAFLHKIAAQKLFRALEFLQNEKPGYGFLIFDALRPGSVQRILWNHVKGTPNERYLANPDIGSLHSFGFAIDLTVIDEKGQELDMGAGFDDFRPIAQPQLEAQFQASGELTAKHMSNRSTLKRAMIHGGFTQLPHEWWHFDALPKAEVRAGFTLVE